MRQLAEVAPGAVRVMVPGGLLLRNGAAAAAEVADHICAASEGHAAILRDAGVPEAKIAITGALALDGLFGGNQGTAPFEVPAGRKVVLYAPDLPSLPPPRRSPWGPMSANGCAVDGTISWSSSSRIP